MENTKTKTVVGLFAMAIILMASGCKEQTVEKVQPVEKEVIVVPPPAPVVVEKPAPKKVVVEKKEVDTPTTISLNKNGVEVSSKKVNVKVEK